MTETKPTTVAESLAQKKAATEARNFDRNVTTLTSLAERAALSVTQNREDAARYERKADAYDTLHAALVGMTESDIRDQDKVNAASNAFSGIEYGGYDRTTIIEQMAPTAASPPPISSAGPDNMGRV